LALTVALPVILLATPAWRTSRWGSRSRGLALDPERLGELAGRLSAQEQRAIDDALALVLDL
jgi:hypothetical protein